jgi:hypothetical protein
MGVPPAIPGLPVERMWKRRQKLLGRKYRAA